MNDAPQPSTRPVDGAQGAEQDWLSYRFELSLLASVSSTAPPRRITLTLDELAAMLRRANANGPTTEVAKTRLGLLKMGLFGDKPSLKGSLRHDGNVLALTGIEADYDAGVITFEEARDFLRRAAILGVLYTSPSHTPEKPRWRFLAIFSRPIVGQEPGESVDRLGAKRSIFMNWLNGAFPPAGAFGGESWTLSQVFYFGRTNANPHHQVEIILGTPIDLLPALELTAIGKPGAAKGKPAGASRPAGAPPDADERAPLVDVRELERLIISGEALHVTMTQLAGKLKKMGMLPVWEYLENLLDQCADDIKATARWQERRDEIPEIVTHLFGKDAVAKVERKRERQQTKDERAANTAHAEAQAEAPPEMPVIDVLGGLRHVAVDQAMRAMRQAQTPFYQRDVKLVRVAGVKAKASDKREITVPGIVPVTAAILGRAMGKTAVWRRLNRQGDLVRIDPPKEVVEQLGDMVGAWPFEVLTGVIATATMRPDCSILSTHGYDHDTGYFLHQPPPMPPIPDRPTKDDAYRALLLLDELLAEFPFVNDTGRSVAMSMLWSPVLRSALCNAVPMHVITAPTPGTGKSYLQDVASVIAVGEPCPVISVALKEEETEKRLVTAALSGRAIIALDNCNGELRGDFLAQVTERPRLLVRPLGGSEGVLINNAFTVFANGNNITIAADLVRRTIRCTLDAQVEDPTDRVFDHNPVTAVLADRGRYIAAILTIVRAYHVAGEPYSGRVMHSYERWTKLVAGALVWLGWETPMASVADLRAEDPERQLMALVMASFPTVLTDYTTGELIAEAEAFDSFNQPVNPAWREAVSGIGAVRQGRLDAGRLGQWLGYHKGRPVDGRKIMPVNADRGRPRWRIERA